MKDCQFSLFPPLIRRPSILSLCQTCVSLSLRLVHVSRHPYQFGNRVLKVRVRHGVCGGRNQQQPLHPAGSEAQLPYPRQLWETPLGHAGSLLAGGGGQPELQLRRQASPRRCDGKNNGERRYDIMLLLWFVIIVSACLC